MTRSTTVRYGHMQLRGLFSVETRDRLEAGDVCVIRSPRGHEIGVILTRPVRATEKEQIGCGSSSCEACATSRGVVLRRANSRDLRVHQELEEAGA